MIPIPQGVATEWCHLIELLRRRAADHGEHRAYTFLGDGEAETDSLTYKELDLKARSLAAWLQQHAVSGKRVVLLHPSGLDFIVAFFGCLYAGAVAVPAYPPKHNRSMTRLQSIISDAQPSIALTSSQVLARMGNLIEQNASLRNLHWLATDSIDTSLAHQWREPSTNGGTLAFLQYTSGSTATPKGVMVSHANILHTTSDIRNDLEHKPDTVLVTWLPTFHDLGLIEGVLQPMITGFPSVIMPPVAFLQQPIRWLQAITRYKATYSAGPNFAYELCVRKTTPQQRETLDLSSWDVAVTAAEPVHKAAMECFYETFAPYGFRWSAFCPSYGLAEATLKVSASKKSNRPVFCTVDVATLEQNQLVESSADPSTAAALSPSKHATRTIVGCGYAQSVKFKTTVTIAHPETNEQCLPDQIGEIWVSSPSVALGYWNKPEETAKTFHAHLADTGQGPFLRTGDLGFLRDGELYITGRLKDLIIIEGRNHYPQDIEKTVEGIHPALRPGCSAAFSNIVDGYERLVVAIEINRCYDLASADQQSIRGAEARQVLDAKQLLKRIRAAVAEEHDVYLHAVVPLRTGTIPKTSSGKIQRQACRAAYLNNSLELWQGHHESNTDAKSAWTNDRPTTGIGNRGGSSFALGGRLARRFSNH